jgi:hypothetical protein
MGNDQEYQICKYKDTCVIFNDSNPDECCRWLAESLIEETSW